MADLQGGVTSGKPHFADHGILHQIDNAFTTSSSNLHLLGAVLLIYAIVEGVEMVGLWQQRRWAEYLTFLVTTSLLPLEIYEIVEGATAFKVFALVINMVDRRLPAARQAPVRLPRRLRGRGGAEGARPRLGRARAGDAPAWTRVVDRYRRADDDRSGSVLAASAPTTP